MIEMPRRGGDPYVIDSMGLSKLKQDYPKIDVECELRKMRNWLEANPRSRKRDVYRFVINWLNRARPMAGGHVSRESSQHYAIVAERIRPAPEPIKPAAPEVVDHHLTKMRQMLGMRP